MITVNKVASLQKQSQDALSIFEKTATRLRNINEKIAAATAVRVGKAAKLTAEIEALDVSAAKNAKLASKLTSFLED